jgi:hypothetical protein
LELLPTSPGRYNIDLRHFGQAVKIAINNAEMIFENRNLYFGHDDLSGDVLVDSIPE